MDASLPTDDTDIEPATNAPLDILALLTAVAAAATVAVHHPITDQITQTASREINKTQTLLATWLDSLGKPK